MGLDIGPKTARALRGGDQVRGHGLLERPDGRLRARAVRGRHAGGRRGRRAHRRGDRRRRGRQRRGARAVRPRPPRHAHVDRRRRIAAAARGQDAAGPRGAFASGSHPLHRRQLEDAQDGGAGRGVHPGAAAARLVDRRRRRRDLRPVPRPAGDDRLHARVARRGLRAEHARGRGGRVHRRGVGRDADGDRHPRRRARALRASRVLQRDRQGAVAQAARGPRARACTRSSASARPRTSARTATRSASCATRSRRGWTA